MGYQDCFNQIKTKPEISPGYQSKLTVLSIKADTILVFIESGTLQGYYTLPFDDSKLIKMEPKVTTVMVDKRKKRRKRAKMVAKEEEKGQESSVDKEPEYVEDKKKIPQLAIGLTKKKKKKKKNSVFYPPVKKKKKKKKKKK